MLWEKIKNVLVGESCEFHDFLITDVDSCRYYLKCSVCKKQKTVLDYNLAELVGSNVLDYSNIEVYKMSAVRYHLRNKNVY